MSESTSFDPFAGPNILVAVNTSEPQREIWTACQLGQDASRAFNESVTVMLRGDLNLEGFLAAYRDLIARHEALRSTVAPDGMTLVVTDSGGPDLAVLDLAQASPDERRQTLARLAEEAVSTLFDLERGPLFRATLVRLSSEEHALVLAAHHIVCDGWSTAVALMDWARLYNARKFGFAADLETAPTLEGYLAFLEGKDPSVRMQDEAYWVTKLAGQLPIFDLPLSRPRPNRKTFTASRLDQTLPSELVAQVRQAGAKSRASLFATLFAAFNVLVHRFTNESDLIVGIPVAGQSGTEFGGLVDHAVNMLPIRSAVVGEEPFAALLARVRVDLLDAQEHQSLTFGSILAKLPVVRDPSRLPLVNIIFNLDRGMTSDGVGFDGLQAKVITNPRRFENFDLFLNAVDIEGRVELECQYNTDLFDASSIERLLASYRLLLEGIAKDPKTNVAQMPILSPSDKARLSELNRATARPLRTEMTATDWVMETARRTPDSVAIEFNGTTWTYAQLTERASALAQALLAGGVAPGGLIGVCVDRKPDLIASALGAWLAGCAYVPLDPDYPRERLSYMVADSQMSGLITTSSLKSELDLTAPTVVVLENVSTSPEGELPLPQGKPTDVAYVIYTSGSTGKPKGVLVPQRTVVNLLTSVAEAPGLTPQDTVLAVTTLSFDIAVSEIWLPLVIGARIVLVTREVASDGSLLRGVVEKEGVTFVDATPATYRLLLGAGWKPNSAQTLICTGEAMPLDLARELLPDSRALWNGYGPTETTVWSTFWKVTPGFGKILIGRPVANTEIYVLDNLGQEVPLGVAGELFIGGEGVSLGYLNRPDLSQERFLPDPHRPGYLLYRTGDLGRYLEDGNLECLGRNDHQVKLRGFRIELGEIEDALTQHPAVASAAVALREDRPGDAKLVGYLVCGGASPSSADLRAHLKTLLPEYMVPAAYVTLTALPLTPSGKVDRKALPAPDASANAAQASEFVAPSTPTEQILAEVWGELLGIGRVSAKDDFFALGGHSLLASQVLARLRRDHGIDLNFRKFFEAPTISELARLIDETAPVEGRTKAAGIVRRPTDGPFPLSISQQRVYLLEEMHPAQRIVHNLPSGWELTGALDPQILQRCIDAIAERHNTLRTTFHRQGDSLVQVISPSVELPLTVIDLRSLPATVQESRLRSSINEKNAEAFDLENGPLFRATLFQLEDQRFFFYTLRHNLIWDGWSFDIFVSELVAHYRAFAQGQVPELPTLPVRFADFVLWHAERLQSDPLKAQQAWWQARLQGAPADLNLPLDYPRKTLSTYAGTSTSITMTREEASELTRIGHEGGTTLFMVLFSAYVATLHRYTGQTDILVGLPVRGRNWPEIERLIGPFINTVVLRSHVNPNASFKDLLANTKASTLEAFSHEEMPLEMLGDRPPIVRALFSFQDARTRPLEMAGVTLSQRHVEPLAAANDLMVWTMEREAELLVVANFSTEVFAKETIANFLSSVVEYLRGVLRDANQTVDKTPILTPKQLEEVERLEGTAAPAPVPGIAAVAAAQAQKLGDAAFVREGGHVLTFAELDRSIRHVAHFFWTADVAPGTVVALFETRPRELTWLWLGALAAGATVLPLDAEAPSEWNQNLMQLAGATVLLIPAQGEPPSFGVPPTARLLRVPPVPAGHVPPTPAPIPHEGGVLRVYITAHGEPDFDALSVSEFVRAAADLGDTGFELGSPGDAVALELKCTEEQGILPLVIALSRGLTLDVAAQATHLAKRSWGTAAGLGQDLDSLKGCSVLILGGATEDQLGEIATHADAALHAQSGPPGLPILFAKVLQGPAAEGLGQPLTHGCLRVCDEHGAPVPRGVWGRLQRRISEQWVDSGYSGAWHRSGSLKVRLDPNLVSLESFWLDAAAAGVVLVKSNAALEAHSRLEAHGHGLAELVVYLVPNPARAMTETERRRELRSLLPGLGIRATFVEVSALPRDASGAVATKLLVSPFSKSGQAHVEPRTATERLLADCYSEVLGLPKISVYDNFFDLGGHSLLCLRVVHMLVSKHGLNVSPRVLLLNTVEQAAQEIDGAAPGEAHLASNEAVPQPTHGVVGPASPAEPGLTKSLLKGIQGILKGR